MLPQYMRRVRAGKPSLKTKEGKESKKKKTPKSFAFMRELEIILLSGSNVSPPNPSLDTLLNGVIKNYKKYS